MEDKDQKIAVLKAENSRLRQALYQREEYLSALHETVSGLLDRLEMAELLTFIMERAARMSGTSNGYLYLPVPGHALIEMRMGIGIFKGHVGLQLKPGQGVGGRVWESGRSIVMADYQKCPYRLSLSGLEQLRALMGIPLKSGDQVVGVLGLAHTEGGKRFTQDDILMVERFAELASMAIDNAHLYQSLRGELAERKSAQAALRKSEERYRTILETIEDGYFEVDLQGNFTGFNQALCRALGYRGEELFRTNYRKHVHPRNRPLIFRTFNIAYRTNRPARAFDCTFVRKDKTALHAETSVSLIHDNQGRIIGFRGIARDISQRKHAEEKLRYLAYHDSLTGLYNRKAFLERLEKSLNQARASGQKRALIFIDLDNFKLVNDRFGHEIGDRLLQIVGHRLKNALREGDFISRLGGDEFTVILENPTEQSPDQVAARLIATIARPYRICHRQIRFITPSIGLSIYPGDGEDLSTLLQCADTAMYQAKEKGNRFIRYQCQPKRAETTEKENEA